MKSGAEQLPPRHDMGLSKSTWTTSSNLTPLILSLSPPLYTTQPAKSTMASTTAQRRLLQEYRALTNNPPEGITAGPVSEEDLLYWEALIQGPEGTPFEGGVFPAELKFPKDYPLAPPSMRFLGEVWHPNGPLRSVCSCRVLRMFVKEMLMKLHDSIS
jgi:hypothetical protein